MERGVFAYVTVALQTLYIVLLFKANLEVMIFMFV